MIISILSCVAGARFACGIGASSLRIAGVMTAGTSVVGISVGITGICAAGIACIPAAGITAVSITGTSAAGVACVSAAGIALWISCGSSSCISIGGIMVRVAIALAAGIALRRVTSCEVVIRGVVTCRGVLREIEVGGTVVRMAGSLTA